MSLIPSPFSRLASATVSGLVGTGAQTFAGDKTFNGSVIPAAGTNAVVMGGGVFRMRGAGENPYLHSPSSAQAQLGFGARYVQFDGVSGAFWPDASSVHLGTSGLRWGTVFGTAGDFSGSVGVAANQYFRVGGPSGDAIMGGDGSTFVAVGTSAARDLRLYAGGGAGQRMTIAQATGHATFTNDLYALTGQIFSAREIASTARVFIGLTDTGSYNHALNVHKQGTGGALQMQGASGAIVTIGQDFVGTTGTITCDSIYTGRGFRPQSNNSYDLATDAARFRDAFLANLLYLGKLATGSIPAAAAGNEGALVYDSTLKKLKFSTGSAWETVTSA